MPAHGWTPPKPLPLTVTLALLDRIERTERPRRSPYGVI